MSEQRAAIVGCQGSGLTIGEANLFAKHPPMGVILFKRNIADPAQLRRLITDLKTAANWDLPIWIDQEGGRVQRLRPPHWSNFPTAADFGARHRHNAADGEALLETATRLLATELRALNIDIDCHPVLDLHHTEAHDIIGDRAFASDTETVIACAEVVIRTLQSCGVLPVVKHFPGHGRANSDSHYALPQVHASWLDLLAHDLAPFLALKHAPIVMTAHIIYTAWDSLPATLSSKILRDWWRNEIGYQGLIVSDDLDMKALGKFGTAAELTVQSLAVGADLVLYCTGNLAENAAVLAACPLMTSQAQERWQTCETIRRNVASEANADARRRYDDWQRETR